jgi:RNA polymerase sigma factor (TIGR02999 family)
LIAGTKLFLAFHQNPIDRLSLFREIMEPSGGASSLLRQWNAGQEGAFDQLVPVVYKELRRLAHYHLRREREGHTLQTTALVHEVYLRLYGHAEPEWANRWHFFAVAARMMRRILVDYSRRRDAGKRGSGAVLVQLDDALTAVAQPNFDMLALDEALEQLANLDERKCSVVEMRFFAGLQAKEIAAILKTTEATVRRDWMIAKAWLYRYLEGVEPDER